MVMGSEFCVGLNLDRTKLSCASSTLETKLIPGILVQNIYQECDAVLSVVYLLQSKVSGQPFG
jgi:hypothetical protein